MPAWIRGEFDVFVMFENDHFSGPNCCSKVSVSAESNFNTVYLSSVLTDHRCSCWSRRLN